MARVKVHSNDDVGQYTCVVLQGFGTGGTVGRDRCCADSDWCHVCGVRESMYDINVDSDFMILAGIFPD